jgi:hypothetical protein
LYAHKGEQELIEIVRSSESLWRVVTVTIRDYKSALLHTLVGTQSLTPTVLSQSSQLSRPEPHDDFQPEAFTERKASRRGSRHRDHQNSMRKALEPGQQTRHSKELSSTQAAKIAGPSEEVALECEYACTSLIDYKPIVLSKPHGSSSKSAG